MCSWRELPCCRQWRRCRKRRGAGRGATGERAKRAVSAQCHHTHTHTVPTSAHVLCPRRRWCGNRSVNGAQRLVSYTRGPLQDAPSNSAETRCRGKRFQNMEVLNAASQSLGGYQTTFFFCESSLFRINQRYHGLGTRLWHTFLYSHTQNNTTTTKHAPYHTLANNTTPTKRASHFSHRSGMPMPMPMLMPMPMPMLMPIPIPMPMPMPMQAEGLWARRGVRSGASSLNRRGAS